MNFSRLIIPRWLRDGITPHHRGRRKLRYVYGGDTETCEGEPISFQFYSEHANRRELIWIDKPGGATDALITWCQSTRCKVETVVYVHNLQFDLVSFFWDRKEKLVLNPDPECPGEFEFTVGEWNVIGVYGVPTYAQLRGPGSRCVYLVDSFSFYRASLESAATVFCPDLPKCARPEGLGSKRFAKSDPVFIAYAMRDAEIAYHIGMSLERMHQDYDIKQSVSVASFAAHVFRRHYVKRSIVLPPGSAVEGATRAYHGGKNNVAGPPGWYMRVRSLDISSAYPHAMREFPSFSVPEAYRRFRGGARVKVVPELGVYLICGEAKECLWPALFDHGFSALVGRVQDVWVTGYELNEALRSGEFTPSLISGFVYDRDRDPHPSPFAGYVDEFYRLKSVEPDKGRRTMFKFILNSLSGKTIQTTKRNRRDQMDVKADRLTSISELTAGGLFNPFIAALITGHTRARIHQLEHKYKAIHTATDGLFTQSQARASGKGLGALECDSQGDLLMLRNKLYILYGEEGPKTTPSTIFTGRHIVKYALHGFAGTLDDLEGMLSTGRRRYSSIKANRLKDSLNRGLVPNKFERRGYFLKVGSLPVNGPL